MPGTALGVTSWVLSWGNVLDQSALYVRVHRGAVGGYSQSKTRILEDREFDFDIVAGEHGWREREGSTRFFQPSSLADHMLSAFLNTVHSPHDDDLVEDDNDDYD